MVRIVRAEPAALVLVAHDHLETEVRKQWHDGARYVTATEHDRALAAAEHLDQRVRDHHRALGGRIAGPHRSQRHRIAVDRGLERELRIGLVAETLENGARRSRRGQGDLHRAAAAHREIAHQMLADRTRRGTAGDLARGRGGDVLDPATADRAVLLAVVGDDHAGTEVTRGRARRADHGGDGAAPARGQ